MHAWLESRRSFDRLTPLLPPSLHVLALDQRGHGDSEMPAAGYDLTTLANDVVEFLDAEGLTLAPPAGAVAPGMPTARIAWARETPSHR